MTDQRITEAELASFERFSYAHEGEVGRVLRRLVDNERRLRALIGRCHAMSADIAHLTPGRGVVGAWGMEGPVVQDLVAEAEAIRAEAKGPYARRCECGVEYPCPEPGTTVCPACGSSRFTADNA